MSSGPKERYVPKKTLRDCIPAERIWDDGMMFGADRYSVTYSFSDINYLTLGEKDQEDIFLSYCSLINSLDPEARTKLTLYSRPGERSDLEDNVFLSRAADGLEEYRKAYNDAVREMCGGTLGTIRKKYLTVSVPAESPDAARLYFARTGAGLRSSFEALGSECEALGAGDRLSALYSMYRGEKEPFTPDLKSMRTLGHDFADWISPDGMEIHDDHLVLGGRYARVLYMKNYASYIRDTLVNDLCSSGREVILTVDMVPVPFDKAVKEAESRLLGVETNITNWQRRQNRANNYSAAVPFDMEL